MSDRIVTLRIDEDVVEKLTLIANNEQRSVAGQIRHICDKYLQEIAVNSLPPIKKRS